MTFADEIKRAVYYSPWRNCYWFARMLMNTDQYGAVGKKDALLMSIVSQVETILEQTALNEEEKFKICRDIIINKISNSSKRAQKRLFSRTIWRWRWIRRLIVLTTSLLL